MNSNYDTGLHYLNFWNKFRKCNYAAEKRIDVRNILN